MIFPFLKGFAKWDQVPVAWSIIGLCFLFYIMTAPLESLIEDKITRVVLQQDFLIVSGRLYHQYSQVKHLPVSQELEQNLKSGDSSAYLVLGSQALRDKDFVENYLNFEFEGDQIAIGNWKKKMSEYSRLLVLRATQAFGLSSYKQSMTQWVTYQFMHGSFIHFLSNMLVFLIFATAIEMIWGGGTLLFIYLSSGIVAGMAYLILHAGVMSPMVGASGAVSGMIGFFAVASPTANNRFIYFFSPMRGHFGFIYLPTWCIFLFSVLPDLASWAATPSLLFSGVAYSSHVFGAAWGALNAFGLLFFSRREAAT